MVLTLKLPLLFFIILLCFCVSFSQDIKKIQQSLTYDAQSSNFECTSDGLDIEVGGLFQVHVDYERHYIYHALCENYVGSNFYVENILTREHGRNDYTLNTLYTTSTQLGLWDFKCKFYIASCYFEGSLCVSYRNNSRFIHKPIICITNIQVLKPGTSVPFYLSANSEYFTRTNEEHMYMFYDGESTNFTCHTTTGGRVRMTHTTSAGKRTSTGFQQTDSVSMYMKLRATNDGDTVEFEWFDQYGHVQFIKLILIVRKDIQGILTIVVNGLIPPRTEQSVDVSYFEYKYYDGESVTVALIKDQGMYGEEIYEDNVPNKFKHYFKNEFTQLNYIQFDLNKKETNMQLFFTVIRKSDLKQKHVVVAFKFHTINYSPYIVGLSMSNILLQYSNATSNIIEYNIGSGKLYLYCNANYNDDTNLLSTDTWYYVSQEVFTPKETKFPRPFQLRPNQTNSDIQCLDNLKKTTYLKLIRGVDATFYTTQATAETILTTSPKTQATTQPTSQKPTTSRVITQTTSRAIPTPRETTNTSTISKSKTQTRSKTASEGRIWGIVLTVVLLVLLVAIGLWKVFNNKKKRLQENESSVEDYENLPEHRQGSMATPTQWNQPDDVTYADPNSPGNIYAEPTSKTKRSKINLNPESKDSITEPKYLNINQINNKPNNASMQNNEPTYANENSVKCNTLNEENTYAEVNNETVVLDENIIYSDSSYKEERMNQNQNLNSIVYAKICHKNANDFTASEMPAYSEIVPQNTRAKLKDNNRYVNVDVENDIEPAYCEIVKSKK